MWQGFTLVKCSKNCSVFSILRSDAIKTNMCQPFQLKADKMLTTHHSKTLYGQKLQSLQMMPLDVKTYACKRTNFQNQLCEICQVCQPHQQVNVAQIAFYTNVLKTL